MRSRQIAASTHVGSYPGWHHRFLAVAALAEARVETHYLRGAYQKLHSIDCESVSGVFGKDTGVAYLNIFVGFH